MQTDLATLKARVLAAADAAGVAAQVEDVVLEPAQDEQGADFLRVIVRVRNADKSADETFEVLLEGIENAVAELDNRYPSVRFDDAA